MSLYVAQGVVEVHLVIEVVEAALMYVGVIEVDIIDFGYEYDVGVSVLDRRDGPVPEFEGHHVGHVAAETVYALCGPVHEDVKHLVPGGGDGVEEA